ncbi:MAG: hypothetical protein GX285_10010 [Clostridiales bacterium]|nr:hypothetical protein [Clostridiales bacterium]
MDALKWLKENIKELDIKEIFDISDETEWIWVNKTVFADIFYSLGFEPENEEEDEGFQELDEEVVFSILEDVLKEYDYIRISQHLFSSWEKNFKPTKDMITVVFVKKSLYRRMSIECQNNYGWFLKAIAADTYFKVNQEFSGLPACYEELYKDNYRIIEDILSLQDYKYISGHWQYIPKDKVLLFYKGSKFMSSWTKQEAETFYEEMSKH